MTVEDKDQIFAEIEHLDKEIFLIQMKDIWNGSDYDRYIRLRNKKSRLERM